MDRLPKLSESESQTGLWIGRLEGLIARDGNLEDDLLTTRDTRPLPLLLLFRVGLGPDDVRTSGWLRSGVSRPGLDKVDERLVRARAGMGNRNQLLPRVGSGGSSAIGCAPDMTQDSSLTLVLAFVSSWPSRA